jgi:ABC-type glycerol-3-phosphate transport system permease component
MPILSTVGRRSRRMRAIITTLYLVLAVGAVTMVYPFLLMVSMSFTSPVDQHEFRLIPRYWRDDGALFRKYEESKYDENINYFNQFLARDEVKFEDLQPPKHVNAAAVKDWQEFSRTLPLDSVDLAHQESVSRITPESLVKYRLFLQRGFKGDLAALNRAYHEVNAAWTEGTITYPADHWEDRLNRAPETRKYRDFIAFKKSQPARYLIPVSADGVWWDWLRARYGKDLKGLCVRHGASYTCYADVHLPARQPANPQQAADWEEYVRRELPFHFIRLDPAAADSFRAAMKARYRDLAALNAAHQSHYTDWSQLPVAESVPQEEAGRLDWTDFITSDAPARYFSLVTPEGRYHQWLAEKYGNVNGLNRAYGTQYVSFDAVTPPRYESDWVEMLAGRGAIRREFAVRNYRDVIQYILLHGRAIWNTAVLVIGLLVVTLVVNPLAAYALSRYQLPGTYKILLFLLATMAFPAEVTMIPGFLLLKSAHLLNTYWALILPAMASGYSIFLLKGFFDSLPRDLYEAAMLDGARESTMFLRITVPLSKPVLAVIALTTFGFAYGSFMWAFLVCQKQEMWTLMVWLFQMQIWAPQFMIMAALVLAAIPTLLVFIFCQNIIMRGIILPVEK